MISFSTGAISRRESSKAEVANGTRLERLGDRNTTNENRVTQLGNCKCLIYRE